MTPITARELLDQFAKTGNLDEPYVPLAEYEALRAILQRWLEIGPKLPYGGWSFKDLSQLVDDTQEVLK